MRMTKALQNRITAACLGALSAWGIERQLAQVQEEAAELVVAVSHYRRGRTALPELAGEYADMLIMMRQLEIVLAGENVEVDRVLREKLSRLENRMLEKRRVETP